MYDILCGLVSYNYLLLGKGSNQNHQFAIYKIIKLLKATGFNNRRCACVFYIVNIVSEVAVEGGEVCVKMCMSGHQNLNFFSL